MTIGYILNLYFGQIIIPLQKECDRLESKIRSRKISDILKRSIYKDDLQFYKQLLREQYKNVGEMIKEEDLFRAEMKEKYPELWERLETTCL